MFQVIRFLIQLFWLHINIILFTIYFLGNFFNPHFVAKATPNIKIKTIAAVMILSCMLPSANKTGPNPKNVKSKNRTVDTAIINILMVDLLELLFHILILIVQDFQFISNQNVICLIHYCFLFFTNFPMAWPYSLLAICTIASPRFLGSWSGLSNVNLLIGVSISMAWVPLYALSSSLTFVDFLSI